MCQGRARRWRVRPWIGLLLVLLMVPQLAAAEQVPFAVAGAAAMNAGHWSYALVAPLASWEEAPFAVAGAMAMDAARWSYALVAPLAAGEDAPFAIAGVAVTDADRWPYSLLAPTDRAEEAPFAVERQPYAQAAPSEPAEEAPIPLEGAPPTGEPAPWPYAVAFLAERVIKQGYTLPLPHGVSLVYTYVERDIKITTVKLPQSGRQTDR